MKYSKLFSKVNKSSKQYDSVNATLLTKAGFIAQVLSGVYTYLPLGLLVLRKIENIVREEMGKISFEILMPSLSPVELWERTNRINSIDVLMEARGGNELSIEKNDQTYVLNSTHEEIATDLITRYVSSYKHLPTSIFQIQTKFRNEARAKSGLLRGREFRMKDMYSFHTTEEDFKEYYQKVIEAYFKVFERVGLKESTKLVLASGGMFSEADSHEFQTICDTGEDVVFSDGETLYNKEIAPVKLIEKDDKEELLAINTSNIDSIQDKKLFKIQAFKLENEEIVFTIIRSDKTLNLLKLNKLLPAYIQKELSINEIKEVIQNDVFNTLNTNTTYFDYSCKNVYNFAMDCFRDDKLLTTNINFSRDINLPEDFYDIKEVEEGDISPNTNKVYETFKASEVGNIFSLGTKYSKLLGLQFNDQNGEQKDAIMGCYGIGVSRLMGIIVEKCHDDKGIIWPESVAPFKIHLIGLNLNNREVKNTVDKYYEKLLNDNVEVLYDDRIDTSAGEKFKDADLIGIPTRIIISEKTIKESSIEIKDRRTGETKLEKVNL